jgi:hypothetical protein
MKETQYFLNVQKLVEERKLILSCQKLIRQNACKHSSKMLHHLMLHT